MTYQSRLHPWCIIRLLPKAQRITVARFRRRGDAEMYLITIKRLIPNAQFVIAFEPPTLEPSSSKPQAESDRPQRLSDSCNALNQTD